MSNLDYVPKRRNLEATNDNVEEESSINAKWQCDPVAPENKHAHNEYHFRGLTSVVGSYLSLG